MVRWTAALGIGGTVLQLLALGFFLASGLPPNLGDPAKVLSYVQGTHGTLTTAWVLFMLSFVVLLGFQGGLRALIAASSPELEWLATTVVVAGVVSVAMALAVVGLGVTAAAEAASPAPQAASVRTLFEASAVLAGAPTLIPVAFYLGAAGSATGRLLPRWLVLVAWAGSVLDLIVSLTAYAGNDPTAFWAADGLVTVLGLLPLYFWTLAASIVFLRR